MSILNDLIGKTLFKEIENIDKEKAINLTKSMIDVSGGIDGLVNKFNSSGIIDIVKSWTGNHTEDLENKEKQVESSLGNDFLDTVAKKSGISLNVIKPILVAIIPIVIKNLLSKDGDKSLMSDIKGSILKNLLK